MREGSSTSVMTVKIMKVMKKNCMVSQHDEGDVYDEVWLKTIISEGVQASVCLGKSTYSSRCHSYQSVLP